MSAGNPDGVVHKINKKKLFTYVWQLSTTIDLHVKLPNIYVFFFSLISVDINRLLCSVSSDVLVLVDTKYQPVAMFWCW